ncbi:MAG: hypothetical protein AAGK04_04000 [Planctomycetota bacterium]
MSRPTEVIAVVFAFAAFAVVLASGFAAGRTPAETLLLAIVAMFVARAGGQVVGTVAEVVVREHVDAHKQERPIPDTSGLEQGANQIIEVEAL